jgi:hypothetical protein
MGGEGVAGFVAQPKDFELAAALGEGLTYTDAGERVGLSERSVQRRMADPGFREFAESTAAETARAHWEVAARRLKVMAVKAAGVIDELMLDPQIPASVRLRAAMAALAAAHEIGATADLAAQVEQLQRAVGIDPRTLQKARAA